MPEPIPANIHSFEINASDAAAQRPVLAIEAARIFAGWANVEFALGLMVSILLGDDAALAILDRLRAKNQKLDAIQAAAAEKIRDDGTRELLKRLFKLLGKASAPRNQLAHCMWGTIDQLPDALLLTNPEVMVKAARWLAKADGGIKTTAPSPTSTLLENVSKLENTQAQEIIDLMRSSTEVWRLSDFKIPSMFLGSSVVALTQFTNAVSMEQDVPEAVQARQHLRQTLERVEQHY